MTGYAVAYGGLLVLGGRLADVFGARRCFGAGLGVFGAALLWCGLAGGFGMLIASRVVQGAGAAVLAPAALALLSAAYPGGHARPAGAGVVDRGGPPAGSGRVAGGRVRGAGVGVALGVLGERAARGPRGRTGSGGPAARWVYGRDASAAGRGRALTATLALVYGLDRVGHGDPLAAGALAGAVVAAVAFDRRRRLRHRRRALTVSLAGAAPRRPRRDRGYRARDPLAATGCGMAPTYDQSWH